MLAQVHRVTPSPVRLVHPSFAQLAPRELARESLDARAHRIGVQPLVGQPHEARRLLGHVRCPDRWRASLRPRAPRRRESSRGGTRRSGCCRTPSSRACRATAIARVRTFAEVGRGQREAVVAAAVRVREDPRRTRGTLQRQVPLGRRRAACSSPSSRCPRRRGSERRPAPARACWIPRRAERQIARLLQVKPRSARPSTAPTPRRTARRAGRGRCGTAWRRRARQRRTAPRGSRRPWRCRSGAATGAARTPFWKTSGPSQRSNIAMTPPPFW